MSFSRDVSPTPPAPGPARRNSQLPFRTLNSQTFSQLSAEIQGNIPPNYDVAAAQQRLQALEAARAAATTSNITRNSMTLGVPGPSFHDRQQYPTRFLPNPAKRRRTSIDDGSIRLDKVRANKALQAHSINIIPPPEDSNQEEQIDYYTVYRRASGWDEHLDEAAFATLPRNMQHSLRTALTSRTVSQRKASERISRELSDSPINGDPESNTPAFDIIGAISSNIEILQAVGRYLRPRDVLNLYSISRDFHATLDSHMRSSVLGWARANCRLAADVFPYQFYAGGTVDDPMARPRDPAYHDIYARLSATPFLSGQLLGRGSSSSCSFSTPVASSAMNPQQQRQQDQSPNTAVRQVPGLVWLQLVYARRTRVRDIIASLARQGHRLLPGSDATLLKLWLIMDLPTNADRCAVIRCHAYFTRLDLYRASVFLVKLLMRTNDPLYGPDHGALVELMLGQRGMTPLWKLLRGKGYTTLREVVQAKIRYDVRPTEEERAVGLPVLGIPIYEMAAGHLEGWGTGREHLLRPDELVVRECARRGVEVHDCLESMAVYGHVDIAKAVDLAPGEEEVYMSDEELPENMEPEETGRTKRLVFGGGGNVPFRDGEWNMKLIRKAKWDELSEEVKAAIREDDKDEKLQALRWEEESREKRESEAGSDSESETQSDDEAEDAVLAMSEEFKAKASLADDALEEETQEPGLFDDDSIFGGDDGDDSDGSDISDDDKSHAAPGSRMCSEATMPGLQSRVTSYNSVPVQTPSPTGSSSDLVGIRDDQQHLMEVDHMDLDDDNNVDATMLGSSMTATPLKFPTPQQQPEDDDGADEEDSEDEFDDDELKAQADDYYSEDELEYDWDAWDEEASVTLKARRDADDDSEEEDEDGRDYRRLY